MRTAKRIGPVNPDVKGDQVLWKIDPPIKWESALEEKRGETSYVVTSAAIAYSGPETYVFATDETGSVLSLSELPGSFRGALDHDAAIEGFKQGNEETWEGAPC